MRRLVVVCGIGASALVACGLSVVGTAPIADEAGVPPAADGGGLAPVAPDAAQTADDDAGCATQCDGTCSDPTNDPANCGGCGKACAAGEECAASACRKACTVGQTRCASGCVDLTSDPASCGKCENACPSTFPLCSASACTNNCAAGQVTCTTTAVPPAAVCVDLTKDPKNCGSCNHVCQANEVCTGSACVPLCGTTSRIADTWTGMTGCVGHVTWENRATLCPAGAHVCSAQEWRTKRGTTAPTFIYWTNDDLRWTGNGSNDCTATPSTNGTGGCAYNGTEQPMRICSGSSDSAGNQCNWIHCGYQQTTNEWFGGCQKNPYAGALCCGP